MAKIRPDYPRRAEHVSALAVQWDPADSAEQLDPARKAREIELAYDQRQAVLDGLVALEKREFYESEACRTDNVVPVRSDRRGARRRTFRILRRIRGSKVYDPEPDSHLTAPSPHERFSLPGSALVGVPLGEDSPDYEDDSDLPLAEVLADAVALPAHLGDFDGAVRVNGEVFFFGLGRRIEPVTEDGDGVLELFEGLAMRVEQGVVHATDVLPRHILRKLLSRPPRDEFAFE